MIVLCMWFLSGEGSLWTVNDMIQAESASSFAISHDETRAVYVKSAFDSEKNAFVDHLFVVDLASGQTHQLTRGEISCTAPSWSLDDRQIAFLSAREQSGEPNGPQLWILPLQGGEPWPLTTEKRAIQNYQWTGPSRVFLLKQEDIGFHETQQKENKDQGKAIDDLTHEAPVRIYTLDTETKKIARITSNTDRIESFAASNDGATMVTVHEQSASFEYDQAKPPQIMLHRQGQDPVVLFERRDKILPFSYFFTPNGKRLFVQVERSDDSRYFFATVSELYEVDLATGIEMPVSIDWDRGLFRSPSFTDQGFITLLADGVHPKLARYDFDKKGPLLRKMIETPHQGQIQAAIVAPSGLNVIYAHSSASLPTQWYTASLKKSKLYDARSITDLNPSFNDKQAAQTEVVRWQGHKDEWIEGMLYYPAGYELGKRYPLVVMIHGGPASLDLDAWSDRWAYPHQLYTQRGAFILKPNYHGSSGYGLAFASSIAHGSYYDWEVPDIEAGVDWLISKGLVDEGHLGVMGWSNGAILTTAITVHSQRYLAASAGAGDVDWASDWGNCAFGASFDNYYFGGTPIDSPDNYRLKSPFYRLNEVTTPTLIFHGDQDTAVPTQQGWLHFRGLQQTSKTPVRFVLFPGEPHGLQQNGHRKRKVEEELAWFDTYLFKTGPDRSPPIKENTPLDLIVKSQSFEQVNGAYGKLEKGLLIPETVTHDRVQIGRFEITKRQFAAFDSDYSCPAGEENMPANDITAAEATAYCAWLSELTSQHYRLPKHDEVQAYQEPGGNILDYWAGYALNPEDARSLQDHLAKQPQGVSLIKPVGQFKPNADGAFDLDGNLAEWVTDGSATKAMGGCAILAASESKHGIQAPLSYCGFRVVMEP
ncbi:MAG: prolyl oligopeptidase family serine peptidase [Acidobacteria bacterium]|nr:prolyl oligopeptidase family serine peptidase [Acidobacteriota bacterium]